MPKIVLENITVKYGHKTPIVAVNNLSTEFLNNKVNVIVGKSGSGKTSLLRAILGLENYDGNIYFDEDNVRSFSFRDKNIGYVSQNIVLYPFTNIFNNIANPLKNTIASADEIKKRVFDVSRMLGIEHLLARKPSQISIGQAQRAAIGRALVKNPNILIFDEAFSNLDVQTRDSLRVDLKKIFSMINCTVIMVTHDLTEAMSFADKIFVLDEGKVVDEGSVEKIIHSSNPVTRELFKEYEN